MTAEQNQFLLRSAHIWRGTKRVFKFDPLGIGRTQAEKDVEDATLICESLPFSEADWSPAVWIHYVHEQGVSEKDLWGKQITVHVCSSFVLF